MGKVHSLWPKLSSLGIVLGESPDNLRTEVMKPRASLLVAMMVVLPLPLSVGAETNPFEGGLKGLGSVEVAVGKLDEDARKCGVSEDSLDAAIRLPLSASQLPINSGSLAFVHVALNVIRPMGGVCVASVQVRLFRYSEEFRAVVAAWHRDELMTGSAATFGSRVNASVEELTKVLIASWLK